MKAWAVLGLGLALAACGDDAAATGDGGAAGGGASNGPCELVDDVNGIGRYADSCVKREWIEDYAGTYESANCTLEIDTSGAAAATFTLEVASGDNAGTYTAEWNGGTGRGNDSYYMFFTDKTRATLEKVTFGAGEAVDDNTEDSIGFGVQGADAASATYTINFQRTISTPFENKVEDCGAATKK